MGIETAIASITDQNKLVLSDYQYRYNRTHGLKITIRSKQNVIQQSGTFVANGSCDSGFRQTPLKSQNRGIPACRSGWPTSLPCCSAVISNSTPERPRWFDRDRFVLSAGHGSMLCIRFVSMGYQDISARRYSKISASVGFLTPQVTPNTVIWPALISPPGRSDRDCFGGNGAGRTSSQCALGNELCNHYTYVIAGDGCLMEGISEEAIALAGHWKLKS